VTQIWPGFGVARAAAEEEARLRDTNAHSGGGRLASLRSKLHDQTVFVGRIAEPYIHMSGVKESKTIVPERGCYGLERCYWPAMGTWIAHGSGNGTDRDTVEANRSFASTDGASE